MNTPDFLNGTVLLIDKPLGWTSFDVVNKMRYAITRHLRNHPQPDGSVVRKIRVGHAGTLDPLATGLLIICTGKYTKQIEEYMGYEKEYTGTLRLGASTPSYDAETPEHQTFDCSLLTEEMVRAAATQFVGEIQQLPPLFSAIKKDGKRLYEHARAGTEVTLTPRTVHIRELELTRFHMPEVDFRMVCSKGTYVRSVAHDLGKALHNGAYLTALRRTRIGTFHVDQAMGVLEFVHQLDLQTPAQ